MAYFWVGPGFWVGIHILVKSRIVRPQVCLRSGVSFAVSRRKSALKKVRTGGHFRLEPVRCHIDPHTTRRRTKTGFSFV